MKTFKASIVLSILFLAASSLVAQGDTLTIRQIFNLKVGDTLVYAGWEDISALTAPYGPNYAYYGRWGFTITQKDTTADSIIYTYQVLGSGVNQNLSVYFLDTITPLSIPFFSFHSNDPTYRLFNWEGFGISLYRVKTCDSTTFYGSGPPFECDIVTSIDTQFNHTVCNLDSSRYFEGDINYTFFENIGVFKAWIAGAGYFFGTSTNPESGGATIQLVYYHSDSIIWMDTTDYILSSVNEVSPGESNFKIFPNPSTGEFYLETMGPNLDKSEVIKIYDLQSKLIYQDKLQTTNHKQLINIPNASAGLYLISLENPTQGVIWRGRLIKL